MGNGARVAAIAVWTYVLSLPSDFCLNLDDCCYVPTLTNNIIFVSYLNKKEFHSNFSNNGCYIIRNEIYILDMSNPILNVNDNKRQKKKKII